MSRLSDYENVRDFTIQAGQPVTEVPSALNDEEVKFLLRMCLSELQELALTIVDSVPQSIELMNECMKTIDKSEHEVLDTEDKKIAAQADAVVDAWYYSCNAFAKKSVDISKIFDIVHEANMAKRDPKTKKFIHREDGKIIKPEGWTPPDVVAEVKRQRDVLTKELALKRYFSKIDESVSNAKQNNIIKRVAKSVITDYVKHLDSCNRPCIEFEFDNDETCSTITFVWEGQLKHFIYNNGSTALLDLKNLKLLEHGFYADSSTKRVIKWFE